MLQLLDRAVALGLMALALLAAVSYPPRPSPASPAWDERARALLEGLISSAGPEALFSAYRQGGPGLVGALLAAQPQAKELVKLSVNGQVLFDKGPARGHALIALALQDLTLVLEAWA
ncbi:MAG: hypothetical protein C4339_05340 [Nitrososphaerota archaeon]